MSEEIDFLLLNPFAEIVEKAQTALDAAQAADNVDMLKAAQALLKEGERARKAIEPIAKRQLALYGESFVTALKDHDGIADQVDALNNLVYVFDDHSEPDNFDAEKFKELGKLAQQTTLRITPILRRMKLEAPAASATSPVFLNSPSSFFSNGHPVGVSRGNSLGGYSTTSYASSGVTSNPRLGDAGAGAGTSTGARTSATVPSPSAPVVRRYETVVHAPLEQFRPPEQHRQQQPEDVPVMGIQGGPDLGWNNGQPTTSTLNPSPIPESASSATLTRQNFSTPPPTTSPALLSRSPSPPPPPPSVRDPPPPVPLVNPWQIGSLPDRLASTGEPASENQANFATKRNFGDLASGAYSQANTIAIEVPERRRRPSTRPDSPTLPSPGSAATPVMPMSLSSSFSSAPTLPPPTIPPPMSPPRPPTSSWSTSPIPRYTTRQENGVASWQQQADQELKWSRNSPANPLPAQSGSLRLDQLGKLSTNGNVSGASPTWSLPSQQAWQYTPSSANASPSQPSYLRLDQLGRVPNTSIPGVSPTWSQPSQQPWQTAPAPTSVPSGLTGIVSPRESQLSTTTASTASSTTGSVFSFDSYLNELSNQIRDSSMDPISPVMASVGPNSPQGGHRAKARPSTASGAAGYSSVVNPGPPAHALHTVQSMAHIPRTVPQMLPREQSDKIIPLAVDIDPGLIPVDSPSPEHSLGNRERIGSIQPADCNIGPSSAFHVLKGFCEGAKEGQRGNSSVRKISKLSNGKAGVEAAKCTNCFFELKWDDIDNDTHYHPSANYRMHGIGYRPRFLTKCHVQTKLSHEPMYACVFCVQLGQTLEESDATVFFSQTQLFSHLARHTRPLPHVPGVTVIDGAELPPEFRNNYDIQFTLPPVTSELDGIRREIQQLPTATAIETFRKAGGALRRPPDGSVPIQFPIGSKIVGIEFPAKFKGDWAVGWFDNVRGPFPTEHIRLNPPPRNEIRTQGTSALQATARWKWASSSVYRNSDWLRLDRNETVTNVIWAHPEHWCWAGINAKGKWGYFPQSHIEPNSLKEVGSSSGSDGVSVVSQERATESKSTGGLLSRFRSHNNSAAPTITRRASITSHSTSSSR
ncbi:hypothetical protein SEPCBS119000_004291 [Sporothrix epigloea]|uniref:SH3 domain-containing protein n=1 Tax=Sporothrix epigloea TaxID=1892477 RepID=A0ABP0DVD4_9PEZI